MTKVNVIWFAIDTLASIAEGRLTAMEFCSKYRVFHHEWELLAEGSLSRLAATEHPWVSEPFLDFRVKSALTEERAMLSPRNKTVPCINSSMGHEPFRSPEASLIHDDLLARLGRAEESMSPEMSAMMADMLRAFAERSERLRKGRGSKGGYTNASRMRGWNLLPDIASLRHGEEWEALKKIEGDSEREKRRKKLEREKILRPLRRVKVRTALHLEEAGIEPPVTNSRGK